MKTKILMVCLGNICRSPLAEGILKSKINPQNVLVDSAGTAGYHVGNKPDSRSIDVANKYGLDISSQRCRKFTHSDFKSFDYIYAMDQSNYNNIIAIARTEKEIKKVKLLLEEAINTNTKEVPDPYYDNLNGFEQVFQLVNNACTQIAHKLNTNQNN